MDETNFESAVAKTARNFSEVSAGYFSNTCCSVHPAANSPSKNSTDNRVSFTSGLPESSFGFWMNVLSPVHYFTQTIWEGCTNYSVFGRDTDQTFPDKLPKLYRRAIFAIL